MNKTIILITGTTTAGKSTFAEALLNSVSNQESIYIIPQAVTRSFRDDDDKRFFI